VSKYAKSIAAAIGMVLLILNSLAGSSAFGSQAQGYINLAIAVLTPVSVYLVKNAPAA